MGGAIVTNPHISSEIEVQPEPPAIGPLNQYFGGAFGLDFGRYLGVEVGFEGYETNLEVKGVGSVTEYAVYAVVPAGAATLPPTRRAARPLPPRGCRRGQRRA